MIRPGTLAWPRYHDTVCGATSYTKQYNEYVLLDRKLVVCPIVMIISHVRLSSIFEGIVFFLCEAGAFWTYESEIVERFNFEEDDN